MSNIVFYNDEHQKSFFSFVAKATQSDSYHMALFYLLSLDENTRQHINDCFDFADDGIKLDALLEPWQTSTTLKVTRLAFNLWNGYNEDNDATVDNIFCCSYAPYFWQAVQLRYPEYAE